MGKDYLGVSIKRLNRRSFFLTILVSMFIFVGAGYLIDMAFRALFQIRTEGSEPTLLIVMFIILWWIYAASCATRRLHDMNAVGWWSIAIFVPFANLVLLIQLFFFKGTETKNRYGQVLERTYIMGLGL